MSKLNTAASAITEKYIRTTTEYKFNDNRKKIGMQAMINKVDSIHKTVMSNKIDKRELSRLSVEINKLVVTLESLINS